MEDGQIILRTQLRVVMSFFLMYQAIYEEMVAILASWRKNQALSGRGLLGSKLGGMYASSPTPDVLRILSMNCRVSCVYAPCLCACSMNVALSHLQLHCRILLGPC